MANLPHKSLGLLSVLFTITAWGALVVGVIGAVGIVMGGGAPQTPRVAAVAVLAVSVLYYGLFLALSGIIKILLAIEAQTRKTP